jgi:ankyrin repeat protein
LQLAAFHGHAAVVQLLLDAHAIVNAATDEGWTALHGATSKGHTAVAQLLLDAHAEVNAAAHNGCTALHEAGHKGHAAVVQLLLDAHAAVDGVDVQPCTVQQRRAIQRLYHCCWMQMQQWVLSRLRA